MRKRRKWGSRETLKSKIAQRPNVQRAFIIIILRHSRVVTKSTIDIYKQLQRRKATFAQPLVWFVCIYVFISIL